MTESKPVIQERSQPYAILIPREILTRAIVVSSIEGQVKQLQKENGSLMVLSQRLRQSIQQLEGQINFHVRSGCQIALQQPVQLDRDQV